MSTKYKLFFFLIFINFTLFAQSPQTSQFVKDSLDKYIEREMKQWDIPGVAVCIVKDGKVVVTKIAFSCRNDLIVACYFFNLSNSINF